MRKNIKLIKHILIALVILIPLIKLFFMIQFGITLINTEQVIFTYWTIYSILVILLLKLIPNKKFIITSSVFLFIYLFVLYLGNGLDSKSNTLKEFTSPNNSNTLIVNTRITWYPNGYIKLSKKIAPFLKKSLDTPELRGYVKLNTLNYDLSWKDDNTVIMTGNVIKSNFHILKMFRETLPEDCDFQVKDKELYLYLK